MFERTLPPSTFTRRVAASFNQRIEPMTRSAMRLLFLSNAAGALLVMAHPYRSPSRE